MQLEHIQAALGQLLRIGKGFPRRGIRLFERPAVYQSDLAGSDRPFVIDHEIRLARGRSHG
ncbi:hypothetical protein D3C80_2206190 [compost metagenome]